MNAFLQLNWGINDLSELEEQIEFISEDVVADSLVYKHLLNPNKKPPTAKKKPNIFITSANLVPGESLYKDRGKSALTESQHLQCVRALKLLQSGKPADKLTESEQHAFKLFNQLQSKIVQENKYYMTAAQNFWLKSKQHLILRGAYFSYAMINWQLQCKRFLNYSRNYAPKSVINLQYDEKVQTYSIEFKCVQNALELGTLARFANPTFKSRVILREATLPQINSSHKVYSQKAVSEDKNVIKLLETYNYINLVISFSGIKRLSNIDPNSTWNIPVVVKLVDVKLADGTIVQKKVVFVDKALPSVHPTNQNFAQFTFKQLLKINLCRYEAFKYPTPDIEVGEDEENKNEEADKFNSLHKKTDNSIHHNVSYRIWNIKTIDEQHNLMKKRRKNDEINILVRSKLYGCELKENGVLAPVLITPKIERQITFGANIATKGELIHEWTSSFFTPFSTLYRARIHLKSKEVISMEKCSIQKISAECASHYNYKPHLSLGVLQNVFEELLQLDVGNYLLQHLPKHGGFAAVLKESNEFVPDAFNLHAEYSKCSVDKENNVDWLPLDVNFMLPSFEKANRLPCTFTPRFFDKKKNKGKKKKKAS